MQYSPKLKKAIQDIKSILEENDIAGYVVLHTPGYAEYLMRLDPSYSCIRLDETKGTVRVKSNLDEDHQGNIEEQKRVLEGTSNMLRCISDVMNTHYIPISALSEILDEKLRAEHGPGRHSSNQEQNN